MQNLIPYKTGNTTAKSKRHRCPKGRISGCIQQTGQIAVKTILSMAAIHHGNKV